MADPKSFRRAYLETVYHAGDVAFTLRGEPTGDVLFGGRSFGLVTAANPRSRALGEIENAGRNAALAAELARLGLAHGPSFGSDPAATWREDGFVVWDADAATLLELGRRFEQNAVV